MPLIRAARCSSRARGFNDTRLGEDLSRADDYRCSASVSVTALIVPTIYTREVARLPATPQTAAALGENRNSVHAASATCAGEARERGVSIRPGIKIFRRADRRVIVQAARALAARLMVRAMLQGPRERGGFFRDVRRWSRPREREGDLYRTCSARTKRARARLLGRLPLSYLCLPTS
jgi:hypothetical protein